jgi:hypothetical protein
LQDFSQLILPGTPMVTWRDSLENGTITILHYPGPDRAKGAAEVMGQRREPRKEIKVSVRIFGTDTLGRPFSENVSTTDVSRDGARVAGVQAQVRSGEVVGLTYGANKGRFSVKWVGSAGTPQAGQVGLENAVPSKPFWDFPLPGPGIDEYGRHTRGAERRKHPRLKCLNSIELQPASANAPIWSKTTEMGMGGCFVEMPMPLPVGTTLKISLWIGEQKLRFSGKVVNSRPGFGIGVQFTEVSAEDVDRLKEFLRSITRIAMK